MILSKAQFEAVNAIASTFYNVGGVLTTRIAVTVSIRVFLAPTFIEVDGPDSPSERYALLHDFQQAYA